MLEEVFDVAFDPEQIVGNIVMGQVPPVPPGVASMTLADFAELVIAKR
jgi:hypothetical protein